MTNLGKSKWKDEIFGLGICCAALLICLAAANPFVDSAFNDDWSYSHVALRLAQTGKFHYNGWGSPTILFQCAWAVLFIRSFGFSFNLLRFASLPFSLAFILLTYLLARKVGLRRDLAQFAALCIAVSPLFVPLAASFMTEPYACFFSLLCLYAAVCSAETENISSAIRWLWVLAVAGILGGSDRQTVWIAPLLLIPYLAWIRGAKAAAASSPSPNKLAGCSDGKLDTRRALREFVRRSDRRFLFHSALAYLACLLSLCLILLNFSQNYGPMQIPPKQWPNIILLYGVQAIHFVGSVLLVGMLMCLPALLCLLPQWRRLPLPQLGALLLASLVAFDYLRNGFGLLLGITPFLGNILTPYGLLAPLSGLGTRPKFLLLTESYLITFLLLASLAIWIYLIRRKVLSLNVSKHVVAIFTIFAVAYLFLLFPGALLTFCYDRYAVPLLPLLLIFILLSAQQVVSRIPAVAWACLLTFAAYGIATTHDYAQNLAARAEAVKQSSKHGISSLHISAGLEQDAWSQLQAAGKMSNIRYGVPLPDDKTHYWLWYYTTAIRPDYVAISSRLSAVPGCAIITIPFTTWAPPSRQAIFVVRRADIPN